MPNVIYTATLDFTDNGVFNAGWRIKQGDFGSSSLNITLSDNGAIVFDDSIEPEIVFKRADGRSVISTMQSAGENSGYYVYNFVGNELAVPGPCVVDVKIVGSDSRTSTASCRFDVIEDTIGYDPTGAGTYNNPVASLIGIALTKSGEAEAWAVGTKNGLPVSSGDPTYHNNSKYWSELRMGSKIKNITGQFYTTTGGMLDSCVIGLEPIQDLHGYSKPWVGGAGKNKLPLTLDGLKALNTSGAWNGNTYTINGITFTINTDTNDNIESIIVNGTKSTSSGVSLILINTNNVPSNIKGQNIILSGCPSGLDNTNIMLNSWGTASPVYDTGNGVQTTFPASPTGIRSEIQIFTSNNFLNVVFKPMIRLASVSDANFEPYTNICPISGHAQVQVGNCGKNKFPYPYLFSSTTRTGMTITAQSDGKIAVTGTNTSSVVERIDVQYVTLDVGSYIISGLFPKTGCYATLRDGDTGSWIANIETNSYALNVASKKKYLIAINITSGNTTGVTYEPMIRKATDSAEFEPYNSYTVTINLGGTYYRGTLDAVSGKLTVTHGFVKGNGLYWTKHSTTSNNIFYSSNYSNDIKRPSDNYSIVDIICSSYDKNAWELLFRNGVYGIACSTSGLLAIANPNITTVSDFRRAIADADIAYPLYTPQIIQLTPTLLETLVGQNNLSAPLEGQSFASAEYRDNMSAVYITDERVVGKWIDGKDIYQRTIDLGSSGVSVPANSSASTGLAKGNVELPIWSTAISPSGQAFPYIGCSVGSTYIMMENKTGNATTVRYFTFQYTKS